MPVDVIRIDEAVWGRAHEARRLEWRSLILEIPVAEIWPDRTCQKMIVRWDEDGDLQMTLLSGGSEPEVFEVQRASLQTLLDEYLSVIHRLQEDGIHSARAEALDMAKRVVHDDGARKLGSALPDLARTHEVRRKVFSFVVSLAVDTSRLASAHRHI